MGLTLSFLFLFFFVCLEGAGDLVLLVKHQTQKPRSNADAGSIILCDKGSLSHQLGVIDSHTAFAQGFACNCIE